MGKIWQKFYDERVPRSVSYPDNTAYQLLQDSVDKIPQGVATLFFGARIRYRELGKRVDRFANALASMGIGKGDRVALVLPNIPAYPIAHFAVLKLGGILVPTNPLYVERELQYQLSDSGAETVVILDQLYPRLAAVRDKTPVKRIILARIQDFLPRILARLYGLNGKVFSAGRCRRDQSRGYGHISLYRGDDRGIQGCCFNPPQSCGECLSNPGVALGHGGPEGSAVVRFALLPQLRDDHRDASCRCLSIGDAVAPAL